jgi:hypothetical protein
VSNITESIERWGSLGLLDGLPNYEREELSQVYDISTKLLLFHTKNEPETLVDVLTDVFYPIIRRLYRRYGVNFDVEVMVPRLIGTVKEEISYIRGPIIDGVNPILEFCIIFADTYEDDYTKKGQFSDEMYEKRVDDMLKTIREILLHKEVISYVDRDNNNWGVKVSQTKKTPTETRYINQKTAMVFMEGVIKDTNKGI